MVVTMGETLEATSGMIKVLHQKINKSILETILNLHPTFILMSGRMLHAQVLAIGILRGTLRRKC